MKKKLALLGILMVASLAGIGATVLLNGESVPEHKGTITIVTSFYPMYIAAENIVDGAEGVELVNLTENHSGCLHDYQLTTKDMKKLEDADIFIMNGGGMEPFIEDIAKSYPRVKIIDASEGIQPLEAMGEHSHGQEEEHEEMVNGHFWMNPRYYKQQIETMAKALCSLDPDHKAVYEKNGELYGDKVDELDKRLDKLDAAGMKTGIFIFHEGFAYLADRLMVKVVHGVNLDQDTNISPGELAHMIEEGKQEQIKYVLAEEQYSQAGPKRVAEEIKADLCIIDPLTEGNTDKDAYIKGMEKNIQNLKSALQD